MMQMVLGALFIVPSLVNCLPKRQTDCAPIHLVVARGSTEPPGLGVLESLVNIIVKANPSATSEAIVYPADLDDYVASVINGTAAVKKQVTAYVERCPRSKIVLIGYSQGAHVIGDGLCGGDGVTYGNYTPGLEKSISSHVSAVVWYGDPRNVAGKPFDKGTATKDGGFPRPANQTCDGFSNILASYCDEGDPFCASGNDLGVHLRYTEVYNNAAGDFVDQKVTDVDSCK